MGCPFLFPQIFANPLAFTTLEDLLVGATGFEPATSWSQTTRATNCATPRLLSGDRVSTGISAGIQDQISGPWKKFRMGWRVLTFMRRMSCVICANISVKSKGRAGMGSRLHKIIDWAQRFLSSIPWVRINSMTASSPWPVLRQVKTKGLDPRMRRAS